MHQSTSRPVAEGSAAADATAAEARELADYLAGQDPFDAQAALWAARRQDGLSAEEESELQAWLAGDPARGAKLEELSGVLGQVDQLPPGDVAALKAALPAALTSGRTAQGARPSAQENLRPRSHTTQNSGRRQWLASWGRWLPQAAMAGMAAMLVTGGWLGWSHWQQQPTFIQSFVTQRGQQLSVTLPEGSALRLDTDTRLEVAIYHDRREVKMPEGQALFDVNPDPNRPFHVIAGATRITVLGTRFSVRHTLTGLEAGGVSVMVEEGRVRVARISNEGMANSRDVHSTVDESGAVELVAGQSVVANSRGHLSPVSVLLPASALSWRDGRVVLNDIPLRDAVAEFERYLDTGLVVNDPHAAELRLNGSFDLRQFSAFKRALPQALPVRLRSRDDGRIEVIAAD
ncbi:MAG: FecR domain-containing protein [Hydrogenophaga sp.]|jgi:transmembrane sensor|nr:FecR domain-containing protein [Hydrogenophaga sp.]